MEALYANCYGKIKSRKKSLGKEEEKSCYNAMLFPGNRDLLSKTLGGPVVSLVCGFVRRDNLRAWCELFTNLYKLKFGGIHPL